MSGTPDFVCSLDNLTFPSMKKDVIRVHVSGDEASAATIWAENKTTKAQWKLKVDDISKHGPNGFPADVIFNLLKVFMRYIPCFPMFGVTDFLPLVCVGGLGYPPYQIQRDRPFNRCDHSIWKLENESHAQHLRFMATTVRVCPPGYGAGYHRSTQGSSPRHSGRN